jgi:hypothetical protein
MSVCVCVKERENVCVCERERESVCLSERSKKDPFSRFFFLLLLFQSSTTMGMTSWSTTNDALASIGLALIK